MKPHSFQICNRQYKIIFKSGFFLLCLIFFILFCFLGTWQVYRYHFKKDLLMRHQRNITAEPIPFLQLKNSESLPYHPVSVVGHYQGNNTLFLQNQYHDDIPGFEVITPFKIKGEEKLLLIDRGWIQKTDQRTPVITNTDDELRIIGSIKLLNEHQFILGQNILEPNKMPLIIQKISINDISEKTHSAYFPFILRLSPREPYGYVREWKMNQIVPERHMAYAIQWYGLAVIMIIGFICFSCERQDEKN